MQFPKDFFKKEKRCGFSVEEMMKCAWAANLEVLSEIDFVCEKYNIAYFADWGTLLGAVRHQGYIPWDDDIDICMPRNDYVKFCKIISEFDNEIILTNARRDANWGEYADRVSNVLGTELRRAEIKKYHGFPFRAGVDIFILDYVPRNDNEKKAWLMMLRYVSSILLIRRLKENTDISEDEYEKLDTDEKEQILLLKDMTGLENINYNISNQELLLLKDKISSIYGDEDGDYLTQAYFLASGKDFYLPKSLYKSSISLQFENMSIPVPNDYDFVLKKEYGDDYMTPIMGTMGHEYPFYNELIREYAAKKGEKEDAAREFIYKIGPMYWNRFINRDTKPYNENVGQWLNEKSNEHGKSWAAMLEIYVELRKLCKENQIDLFVIGSTLSEITHSEGKFPITDDFHLAIFRKDYVNFLKVIQEHLNPWFDYRSIYTHADHDDLAMYVLTDGYLCTDEEYKERFYGCDDIVGLDIAIIDSVDKDGSKDAVRMELARGLMQTAGVVSTKPPYTDAELSLVAEWKKIANISIDVEKNIKNEFFKTADTMVSLCTEQSDKVRLNTSQLQNSGTVYKREWFDGTIDIDFATVKVAVPKGYKEILKIDAM